MEEKAESPRLRRRGLEKKAESPRVGRRGVVEKVDSPRGRRKIGDKQEVTSPRGAISRKGYVFS